MRTYLMTIATLGLAAFLAASGFAQTPAPIIMQAATPAPPANAQPVAAPVVDTTTSIMAQLQQIHATNAATIKKQEAALATLDALQKAADEIKIFSKRG